MKPKSAKLTTPLYLRVTKDMKKDIERVAKHKKMEPTAFCRGAIMAAIEKSTPKFCACGNHWGHTGKHFVQLPLL